jgi:hypothetical protein
MAGSLLNVVINSPPTQLGRSARVAYACRALQLVMQELFHGGVNVSDGKRDRPGLGRHAKPEPRILGVRSE